MGSDGSTSSDTTAASPGYAVSGKIMLTAIVVMLTAVLLVLFLHLYFRWLALRRSSADRSRRRRRGLATFLPNPLATRRGLDRAVLESIPVVAFSANDGGGGGDDDETAAECAVCLSEFEEGEKVRMLPPCGHRFHVDCIDAWFRSRATCPLCRSSVETPAPPVPSETTQPTPILPESSAHPVPDLRSVREVPDIGSSAAAELRIEVPERESATEDCSECSALKSPGNRRLSLIRILSGDLRLYRNGGESTQEQDLEQGEIAAYRPSPPSQSSSPATGL